MNQYVETTENSLVHTYNRFPVVLDRGEGVYLYDTEGKKYLDFAAGIAVSGLGYGNPEFNGALKARIFSKKRARPACGAAALRGKCPAARRQRRLRRSVGWTGCSSPTAAPRPSRAP